MRKPSQTATPTTPSSDWSGQGTVYAAFIAEQHEREWQRYGTLNNRANAVMTRSGVLIGLTVTLGVWSMKSGKKADLSEILGALSVALFIGATVLGLLASRGRKYKVKPESELLAILRDDWADSETTARCNVSHYRAWTTGSLRTGNNTKSILIEIAIWVQISALLAVSAAVAVAIFR